MVWIKYLTNGAFVLYRENSLLRIILRTSYLRCGINTSILKWFTYGINNFEKYADQIKQLEAEGQGKNLAKPFKIDRGQNLPGKIEIMDFVPHCLRCFKQIITESNKISYKAGLDLLRVPS